MAGRGWLSASGWKALDGDASKVVGPGSGLEAISSAGKPGPGPPGPAETGREGESVGTEPLELPEGWVVLHNFGKLS